MQISVRPAVPSDMKEVLALIQELADYEKAPLEVENTEEGLINDGFGENKVFDCLIAESETLGVVGMALFYTGYSTWKGPTLYLEDFLVKESLRGKGIGRKLFDAVVDEAKRRRVKRMDWQVLDWNEPAINFYKKYDAILDPEWINGRLFFSDMN